MKYPHSFRSFGVRRGFALVVTLALMILLALLAVGLLSLSAVSLRGATHGLAAAEARANARMALMLALGDLQKHTGPDQRITITADQRAASDGDGGRSMAVDGKRHWTGVFDSWKQESASRPQPVFRRWLVSAARTDETLRPEAIEQPSDASVLVVGQGTLGPDSTASQWVSAPALKIVPAEGGEGPQLAWWTGDQGVKAAVAATPSPDDGSAALVRAALQGGPPPALGWVKSGNTRPFAALDARDERLARVTSWRQTELLASDIAGPRPLFHDLAPFSTGLLTNLRVGGFRQDLSMFLERPATSVPRTPLYRVGGEPGINMEELWAYYHLHKDLRQRARLAFTTGGRSDATAQYLRLPDSPSACAYDDYFYFKMPVIVAYQMVYSFETRAVQSGATTRQRLRLVYDPIITLWNPLDVAVEIPQTCFLSVKYMNCPYDVLLRINGGAPVRCPLVSALSQVTENNDSDYNFCTISLGLTKPLVFKPGEVIKLAQTNNAIVRDSWTRNVDGNPGFTFNGGISMPMRNSQGTLIDLAPTDTISFELAPNNLTFGKTNSSGNSLTGRNTHTRHFSLTHHEVYAGRDRGDQGQSLGYGGIYIDFDFGDKRLLANEPTRSVSQSGTKAPASRIYANQSRYAHVFKRIDQKDLRTYSVSDLTDRKNPFVIMGFEAKTEQGSDRGTRGLARFNPAAKNIDFFDLQEPELDRLPYEWRIEPLVSWRNRSLEVSANGNAFFGGGMNAEFGTSFITTHTVPREPPVSLAMFQHAFANGFDHRSPRAGYATLNVRDPMLPHVSHAIGNSLAPAVLPPHQTENTLPPRRPLADHSYLANRELWDDWFLSGIAPQTLTSFDTRRDQRQVARDFFAGKESLPVGRYRPDLTALHAVDPEGFADALFGGRTPTNAATLLTAAHIRVEGLFNVNSTSVEAWKALLGGLRGHPIITRNATGSETTSGTGYDTAPVANLLAPEDLTVDGSRPVAVQDPGQWVGRRTLNDEEIDRLARALVREVRLRGPFLNLGDFINRRVGRDPRLAQAGTIQSALDSKEAAINTGFQTGGRGVPAEVAGRLPFPQAEAGAKSHGAPGIIKQADILTPLAPILAARSDSFVIRGYGESVDKSGRVLARAWCEAVVERSNDYMDPTDAREVATRSLKSLINREFGRRYQIVSFRWLSPTEV